LAVVAVIAIMVTVVVALVAISIKAAEEINRLTSGMAEMEKRSEMASKKIE
jgi:hypothetical protein